MRSVAKIDWKLVGYGVSSFSVVLLGAAAWPKADQAWWHMHALIGGMALSVLGMVARYISHRIDRQEIEEAKKT